MQINKFKKIGKNKYKITLDDTDIIIYEDIIFKYDLLIKKTIDIRSLDNILNDNRYYEAYYMALNYISIKMRNKKEIISYLTKKEIEEEYINFAIEKIVSQGLLNNTKYIEAFINDKINLSNDGPYKIKRLLLELDEDENDIDNYLYKIDDSIWIEKVKKLVEKKSSIIKNKSYYQKVQKIKNDLFNLGYDKDMIESELYSIKYDNSSIKKEYEKAKRKYNDNNKIVSYLLRKGYTYEEINNID